MNVFRRIIELLRQDERKRGVKVAVALFFTTLLDFVSLASLLPVLYWLLKGGENSRAALFFSLLAVALIIVKGSVNILFSRYQHKYMLSIYRRLSMALYEAYFNKGLLFIKEEGTNRLTYDTNFISYTFSQNILPSLLRMMSDSLLIVMVAVALAIYDFKTSLILVCSFMPFMAIYLFGVRKRVREIGKEDIKARRKQGRIVMETFKGYADLQVSGAFPYVHRTFKSGLEEIGRNRLKMDTLMRLPLFLGELAVVLGLGLLVVTRSGDISLVVGVFAVASFRLLPALRGIMTGFAHIENASYSLDIIEKAIGTEQAVPEVKENAPECGEESRLFSKNISFENISYSFPDGESIFSNFNCSIGSGEFVGFNGYSGAGKTTLFNLLLGFIEPQEGSIKLDGVPLVKENRARWLKQVGYVSQDVFIFQGTLAENIALGENEIDRNRVEEVLEMVCLKEWREGLAAGIDTEMSEEGKNLSGGQRQRIAIARAIYKEVDVLLLDEATSALDNATELEINRMLLQLRANYTNLTILSIAHRESSLAMCDRVVRIG
ncbi:MAG: ABC transporter ATP-binding protein [Bacteroidales bacterium]|nr:ABC transporter ATP-binding protein [Bacteroidales bacterium]